MAEHSARRDGVRPYLLTYDDDYDDDDDGGADTRRHRRRRCRRRGEKTDRSRRLRERPNEDWYLSRNFVI